VHAPIAGMSVAIVSSWYLWNITIYQLLLVN
jgi:hypothetical protein